jgi:hypothetical protein
MFGSLDAHTARVLTFTEAAVTMQTTRSPASSVGALHVSANPAPADGLGAAGAPFPHPDAIDTTALRAMMRLIGMAAEMIASIAAGPPPRRRREAIGTLSDAPELRFRQTPAVLL